MSICATENGLLPEAGLKKLPVVFSLHPHLPVSKRKMAELWRCLKHNDYNQTKLVLLIDQQGSMAPFSLLIEALTHSLLQNELLNKAYIHFFHDCPEGFLWKHPNLTLAQPLEEVLCEEARNSIVLIVSDAGAAHGYYDKARLTATRKFLTTLGKYTRYCIWLNPMPRDRWEATTAEDIANSEDISHAVQMFSIDETGLEDAITYLLENQVESERR